MGFLVATVPYLYRRITPCTLFCTSPGNLRPIDRVMNGAQEMPVIRNLKGPERCDIKTPARPVVRILQGFTILRVIGECDIRSTDLFGLPVLHFCERRAIGFAVLRGWRTGVDRTVSSSNTEARETLLMVRDMWVPVKAQMLR